MTDTESFAVGTATVKLRADGDRIVASVRSGKPFEPETLVLWGKLCKPGGTVVDVGTYTGLFTIGARLLGCRAIAFEPMPFNVERFKENAALNGVSDKINREVVSDTTGKREMGYNPIPFTAGASLLRKTGTRLSVPSITIDSLSLRRVDAIKIDVERAEELVLQGARDTLVTRRPVLVVEVLEEPNLRRVMALAPGYTCTRRMDHRNWLLEPAHD